MFSYNRSVIASALSIVGGLACLMPLVSEYYRYHFTLEEMPGRPNHLAVLGLLLLIVGFGNFVFTLVLHAATLSIRRLRRSAAR